MAGRVSDGPVMERDLTDTAKTNFDLGAYLARLGLKDVSSPGPVGLAQLHEKHLCAIPFENLDVQAGIPICLEPSALFDKMVVRRRGGFCFEMNGLFSLALAALGIPHRNLLARVWYRGGDAPRPKTHQVILAEAGGATWLADVGFGGPGFRHPLPFETKTEVEQPDGRYRLEENTEFGFMLKRLGQDGAWKRLYSFDLSPAWPADFEIGSHYAATHPSSIFTQMLIVTMATPSGRMTLMDHELIIKAGERNESCEVAEQEIACVLRDHFGLDPGTDLRAIGS